MSADSETAAAYQALLSLPNIRAVLIRLEDTILFDILERAQFYRSRKVYERGAFPALGPDRSFLEYALRDAELLQAKLRRYNALDENPFFPEALDVQSLLPPLPTSGTLAANHRKINLNDRILSYYTTEIVPAISAGDSEQPENYGSCAMADIQVLQALSRRIHFGKFVAEAKFRADPEGMSELIRARNIEGIMAAITDATVEQKILDRVREKAHAYGMDAHTLLRWSMEERVGKLDPAVIVDIYTKCIIPLTKDVEVDYLLQRLDADADPNLSS